MLKQCGFEAPGAVHQRSLNVLEVNLSQSKDTAPIFFAEKSIYR